MVFHTIGRILQIEALLMLLPLAVALFYGEVAGVFAFTVTLLAEFFFGTLGAKFFRSKNRIIYSKEGFAIVALAWIIMSAVGALPFVISGEIPSYVDAFFETVSGFTTTGASVLNNVEALSKGMLFWRSFTHWIGGMGVIVFVMALIPNLSERSIHIMRAEMPGPVVDKIVPKIKNTAKILYLIYIALTLSQIILLRLGGVDLFESMVYSFGTAGTGGFGIKADSLASYSPYVQWVITAYMFIFGINFNLYYLVLIHRAKAAIRSTELWCYFAIIGVSAFIISINTSPLFSTVSETIRHSCFQTVSLMTTTGFSTVDFNMWPSVSKTILLILMFVGGCAGSTAGGLKVSRVIIILKTIMREFRNLLHPRSVSAVRHEGKPVEDRTAYGVCVYFAIYMLCFFAIFFLISFDNFDFETNFTATAATINNIGPGFSEVGPMSGFAGYSVFSKLVLSFSMLLGRLELYPLLIVLTPGIRRKK
jgi:trk system potassium uptake protein TrkH